MDEARQERIVEFLKGYAELAQDLNAIKPYAPFRSGVSMAHGACYVADRNDKKVAFFHVDHAPDGVKFDYHPSMPVAPEAMAMSSVFAEILNKLAEVG